MLVQDIQILAQTFEYRRFELAAAMVRAQLITDTIALSHLR